MSSFPEDIIAHILSLLPVKFLLRYRSVCSSWLDLIDSPNFINHHLSRNTSSISKIFLKKTYYGRLIVNSPQVHNCFHDLCYFDFVSINPESRLEPSNIGTSVSKITLPTTKSPLCGINPNISSNNGIVCIYNRDDKSKSIILINPSTRRYQQLPPFPIDNFHASAHGFGFDKLGGFKFILHVRLEKSLKLVVLVYELKSNLWRTMESALDNHKLFFHTEKKCISCGVFFSGSLHWGAYVLGKMSFGNRVWGPNVDVIVGFDLATEQYRLMGLPECSKTFMGSYTMDVLEGCLCLCFSYCNDEKGTNVDVWVMKEYGIVKSWTRLYVIELPDIEFQHRGYPLVWPRVLSDSGDHRRVLFEVKRGLLWYDLGNKSVEHIILRDGHELLDSYQNSVVNSETTIVNSESLVHLSDSLRRERPTTTTTVPNAKRILLPSWSSKRKTRE